MSILNYFVASIHPKNTAMRKYFNSTLATYIMKKMIHKNNLRSNWIRGILSNALKIRSYTMIGFDRLLFDVYRLFALFSSDIHLSDLLNPDQIYVAGNCKIRSMRSVCIRYDSGASDVRKTSGYAVLNDT
jgi:hypothetical protein